MTRRVSEAPIELGATSTVNLHIDCAQVSLEQGMDAIALLKAAESAWVRR